MERRDRIACLLEFYTEVLQGFSDPPNGGGDGVSRFTSTWTGPVYTQLKDRLIDLGLLSPGTYQHLTGFYIRAQWVRRSRCPRCRGLFPPSSESRTQNCDGHQHGRRYGQSVTLEPFMERVVPVYVNRRLVDLALDWMDTRWQGPCDLPVEIRECLHHRQVVELKRGRPLALA